MASTTEETKAEPAKVLPEDATMPKKTAAFNLFRVDLGLRLLVVATTVVAVVLMITGSQTKTFNVPFAPFPLVLDAKFNYSPAFIYFVVANSVACLYSGVTIVASVLFTSQPKLLFLLAQFDALMVGIVGSATGAGASIAYLGLHGNSHVGWLKVCNLYGKFCRHAGISIIVSLVTSIILVLLVSMSTYSLHRRSIMP